MTGYETYCLYLALKSHFSSKSYDFFKYGGKVTASKDSFLSRKDRFKFEKLARKVDSNEMRDYLLANILADRTWVGDMLDDDAVDTFKNYQKVIQSLTYTFTNDIDTLMGSVSEAKQLFQVKENELPIVVQKLLSKEITLETFVILNKFIDFIPKFDEKLKDDYLWEKISFKATKYAPFVDFDQWRIVKIMKEKMV